MSRQKIAVGMLVVIVAAGILFNQEATPDPIVTAPRPLTIDDLQASFTQMMQAANPMYNDMTVHLVLGDREARSLVAAHPFFSKYDFAHGPFQAIVQQWVGLHCGELHRFDIRYIGLAERDGNATRGVGWGDLVRLPVNCVVTSVSTSDDVKQAPRLRAFERRRGINAVNSTSRRASGGFDH